MPFFMASRLGKERRERERDKKFKSNNKITQKIITDPDNHLWGCETKTKKWKCETSRDNLIDFHLLTIYETKTLNQKEKEWE